MWVLLPVAIFLFAGGAAAVPWIPAGWSARLGSGLALGGLAGTLGVLVGRATGMVSVDWFAAVAAVFVAVLSCLIQLYGVRQFRADARQRWFVCWLNVLTAGSVGVLIAPSVLWFAAAWTVVGAALVMLLAMYPRLRQARVGLRRTILSLAVGDAALWSAVLTMVLLDGGDVSWGHLGATVVSLGGPAQTALALLVVVAGLARSAQLPFHTWLPVTLAAPTPVSAIMHAGVVNAAAFLMIRFAGIVSVTFPAVLILFVAGSATLLVGAAGYLVHPDLKGRLVASTTAQMGFMVMTLGVGAYAAAVFHLIGHGFYKANLFLRSGSQVSDLRRRGERPAARRATVAQRVWAACVAVIVPSCAILATTVVISPPAGISTVVLAGYGCVTAGVLLYHGLLSTGVSWLLRILSVLGIAAAGVGYAAVVHGFDQLIGSDLPAPVVTVPGWALLAPLLLVALMSLLPAVPAARVPRLYGLVKGLAGTPLPRVRVSPRPRTATPALNPIIPEVA